MTSVREVLARAIFEYCNEDSDTIAKAQLRALSEAGYAVVRAEITSKDKARMIGEYIVKLPYFDEDGGESIQEINVPWVVIKQIIKDWLEAGRLT